MSAALVATSNVVGLTKRSRKPCIIEVHLDSGAIETHELAKKTDWAVMFEDVLEVKAKDGTHYYAERAVRKWIIKPINKESPP